MRILLKHLIVRILTFEARYILRRYSPRIIAVTGSVGKTSAKDAIFIAIEKLGGVRKSEKSLNSELGVPLTIIGRESGWGSIVSWLSILLDGAFLAVGPKRGYPSTLVLEVGADHPGDIQRIARWLRPDIAVITGVPAIPAHIEAFASPEEVAQEKSELVRNMKPGGTAVIYGDEPLSRAMGRGLERVVYYGCEEDNHVRASHREVLREGSALLGIRFRVDMKGSSVPFMVHGVLGRAHVYPALAACAVADVLGVTPVEVSAAYGAHEPAPGRMRILEGVNGAILIDDTYNASPAAMVAALETLHGLDTGGRKVALLGDMLELGAYETEGHRRVGEMASGVVSELITVGERAAEIAEAARGAGLNPDRTLEYKEGEARVAGEALAATVREGDVVLVKGSQGMRMERAVAALLKDPAQAGELLVRQSPEWLAR